MAGRHEHVVRVGRRGERITREPIEALVQPLLPNSCEVCINLA
jgi:hypothetical protein